MVHCVHMPMYVCMGWDWEGRVFAPVNLLAGNIVVEMTCNVFSGQSSSIFIFISAKRTKRAISTYGNKFNKDCFCM